MEGVGNKGGNWGVETRRAGGKRKRFPAVAVR